MSWKAAAYVKALVLCPNGERITRSEKLVALVLADSHQDKGNAYTYPALKTIAEDALMDERVCRRLLASLERKGVIQRERAANQGRGQITFYRFPHLDGPAKGGHVRPPLVMEKEDIMSPFSFEERRTEGGRKGDKTRPALKEEQEQEQKQKHTPCKSPSLREGDGLDLAAAQVCSALAIANPRKRKLLRRVIELEAEKGQPPPTVALAMIAAWREQAQRSPELRCKFGIEKFYGEGYWKDENRWHWNEELLRTRAGAAVGM